MKKATVIRILTLAIMASMLMTSCGGETGGDTTEPDTETTVEETKDVSYPYEIKKLDGREFRFLNCVDLVSDRLTVH